MIDINTLRLGNLLYFSDPDNNIKNAIATVKGVEDNDMVKFETTNVKDESSETRVSISTNQVSGWGNSDQFDYILLDEKCLLKTNFFTNKSGYYYTPEGLEVFFSNNGELIKVLYKGYLIKGIHHLDQLQNLYFTLASEELKIK